MGVKAALFAGTLLLTAAPARMMAAPFVNLDFEQAVVPPGTPPSQSFVAAAAFPGWTPRIGGAVQTTVYYDDSGIGEPAVALYDKAEGNLGIPVLQGHYYGILIGDTSATFRASLSQIGDIPADAKSIRFLSEGHQFPPVVTINGTEIPVVRLTPIPGTFYDVATFGGDISAFAGTTSELRFTSPVPPHGVIASLDEIVLSAQPIPEPRVAFFCVIAAIARARWPRCRIGKHGSR